MQLLPEAGKITFDELNGQLFDQKKLRVLVARLDKIHPVISGNKLFKLHYFIEQALADDPTKTILSFGGAYSNHLVATAYACRLYGLKCIGVVRGEKPAALSHTLLQCEAYGMQLKFISREAYKEKDHTGFGDHFIIPEGGYHPLGAKGASLVMDYIHDQKATHICTAVGTATTLAGLVQNIRNKETVVGIPVLKNMHDMEQRLSYLCGEKKYAAPVILDGYHFGGYGKKTNELIRFMNEFYKQFELPTDFVYTAKMMYAVMEEIKAGFFAEGSTIICLHTGGLQGNNSLPEGALVF